MNDLGHSMFWNLNYESKASSKSKRNDWTKQKNHPIEQSSSKKYIAFHFDFLSIYTIFIFADRVVSISIQFNCILICVLQNNTVNLIKAWLTINIIYIEYRKS